MYVIIPGPEKTRREENEERDLHLEDGILGGPLEEDGAGKGVLNSLNEGVGLLTQGVLVDMLSMAQDLREKVSMESDEEEEGVRQRSYPQLS